MLPMAMGVCVGVHAMTKQMQIKVCQHVGLGVAG